MSVETVVSLLGNLSMGDGIFLVLCICLLFWSLEIVYRVGQQITELFGNLFMFGIKLGIIIIIMMIVFPSTAYIKESSLGQYVSDPRITESLELLRGLVKGWLKIV